MSKAYHLEAASPIYTCCNCHHSDVDGNTIESPLHAQAIWCPGCREIVCEDHFIEGVQVCWACSFEPEYFRREDHE